MSELTSPDPSPVSAQSEPSPAGADEFVPLLPTTDWGAEWQRLQAARRRADDAAYWDARAKSFGSKDAPSRYVERFLELAGVRDGETVFDMGCGTGSLAVPLGIAGHSVVAADFSSGMLGVLRGYLEANGVECVRTVQMSWEDDWESHGVAPKSADVAFASRSIATADLRDSLARLDAVARRRVCITLPTGSSPRINDRMLADIGFATRVSHDYQYAINILIGMGALPEISYIRSERRETFESPEEAVELYRDMVSGPGTTVSGSDVPAARERAAAWVADHLVENPTAGAVDSRGRVEGPFTLSKPRENIWAFISWEALTS